MEREGERGGNLRSKTHKCRDGERGGEGGGGNAVRHISVELDRERGGGDLRSKTHRCRDGEREREGGGGTQ